MPPIQLAIVGLGKIARDQHLPAIAANPSFALRAIASPEGELNGVPRYPTIESLLAEQPSIAAIAICTPPQVRYAIARTALLRGCHVFLEKPPCATVSEASALIEVARANRSVLFASWHSREAPGVEPARDWLASRTVRRAKITWKEDVRYWHPGQTWLWQAGGMGVFDPAINALSIATRILREPLALHRATLKVPSNCACPIAATMEMSSGTASVVADLDFLQTGPQTWDIEIETNDGHLLLSQGGAKLAINGISMTLAENREYPNLYARFASLIAAHASDVDLSPLQLVNDALSSGQRIVVERFDP